MTAILGALFHRERTGEGQHIDISMTDVLFSLIFDEALDIYEDLGMSFQQGNRIMRFSPFNAYPTQDGWLVIGIGHDAMWRALCDLIGREDLGDHADWGRMDWRGANTTTKSTPLSRNGRRPAQQVTPSLCWKRMASSPARSKTSTTCSIGRTSKRAA